jgi:alpha-1,6-mannosyltransferase
MPGIRCFFGRWPAADMWMARHFPLIALALLFYVRHKPAATGVALAAATLVKLYPIALFPALYRRSDWRVIGRCRLRGRRRCRGVRLLPERRPACARLFARICQGGGAGIRQPLLSAYAGPAWLALGGLPTAAFYGFAALLLLGLALWAWLRSEAGALAAIRYCFASRPL